jgi:hypothetical protein
MNKAWHLLRQTQLGSVLETLEAMAGLRMELGGSRNAENQHLCGLYETIMAVYLMEHNVFAAGLERLLEAAKCLYKELRIRCRGLTYLSEERMGIKTAYRLRRNVRPSM